MADTENKKDGIDTADQTGVGNDTNTTGEANAQNDTGSDAGSENTSGSGSTEKTFTQKQVSSMMAKEKRQGRDAAFKEMGIDPNDSKMVNMFKAFIQSQKTNEQKANEEAAAQAAKIAEAEHRAMVAEAKAEAMQLGVLPQYADDAVILALSKMSDDDTDLKSIIGELKTKYPVWFDASNAGADGKNATGQKGTGASVNNSSDKGGKENKGMGARLAAQRKAANGANKKSFWS